MNETKEKLRRIALLDGRYSPEAFTFLFEALEVAVRIAGKDKNQGTARHVSGQEVLAGMREHALATFGPLAASVWRTWGIRESLDWGRIVFLLVDHGLLKRQEEDSIEDFREGFDFEPTFDAGYREKLNQLLATRRADPEEA